MTFDATLLAFGCAAATIGATTSAVKRVSGPAGFWARRAIISAEIAGGWVSRRLTIPWTINTMCLKEGAPRRGRPQQEVPHVLGNDELGDVIAEEPEFGLDPTH